jgi:nucleoside-diphosphate-sugar epimerase
MRILITGASGFIGTHLLAELSKDHEVFGLDSFTGKSVNIFKCDLSDLAQSQLVLKENKINKADVIIHLAGVTAEAGNLEDVSVLNKNNLFSLCVAKLAENLSCQKIINFSSSSVYPNIDGTFSETSLVDPSPNPDAIYGLSKYNSEVIISRL